MIVPDFLPEQHEEGLKFAGCWADLVASTLVGGTPSVAPSFS